MTKSVCSFLKRSLPLQIVLFYIFVSTGLIVNFLQLLTLVIWPFNKQLYRKVNTYLAYCFWCELTALAQYWSNTTVDLYINEEDYKFVSKEHALCIMNHKYDVDWLMGWIICQQIGLLGGSKIIGKRPLSFIPLIGWCWLFTESIFINRQWETDKTLLIQGMDKILTDYPKDHYFNVLMFCEGTRFTKKKHEESMKVAKAKGLPELKHHLLPRAKGFSLLARGASDRISAIYDLNVGIEYKNGVKPDLNSIRNGLPLKAEMFVRRIPFKQVPQDEEGSTKFLYNFYKEKDDIYDVYEKTGSFKSLGVHKIEIKPNYYDLYITLFWMVTLCIPLAYGLYLFFINANIWMSLLLVLAVILMSFLSNLFISVTQTETGSNYGLEKNLNGNKKSE